MTLIGKFEIYSHISAEEINICVSGESGTEIALRGSTYISKILTSKHLEVMFLKEGKVL